MNELHHATEPTSGTPDVVRPSIFAPYPGIIAGMSTRSGGISPEPLGMNLSYNVGDDKANVHINRLSFLKALGADGMMLATTTQIHSETVVHVVEGGNYPSCDALITSRPGILLSISIADCVPILLYDSRKGVVAAVHAGWRGTLKRITVRTVAAMVVGFESDPSDILGYVGAAAGICCYEVGEEVAGLFGNTYLDRSHGAKPHLDVRRANLDLLVESGMRPENIEISSDCTICSGRRYHSFRRDSDRSGRMWAVIGKC